MSRKNESGSGYLYGICTNRDKDGNGTHCSKCDSKEIQKIRSSKDFVCEECGEKLMKTEAPDEGGNSRLYAIIAAVVIVIAVIVGFILFGGSGNQTELKDSTEQVLVVDSDSIRKAQAEQDSIRAINQARIDSLRNDSIAKAEAEKNRKGGNNKAAPISKPANGSMSTGTKDLGYAVYRGSLKNGKPDGVNGRLTFKTQHVIDSKDPKARVAEAGDYVIGEFVDGHLVQGRWYGADNTLKSGIIIGM